MADWTKHPHSTWDNSHPMEQRPKLPRLNPRFDGLADDQLPSTPSGKVELALRKELRERDRLANLAKRPLFP